MAFRVLVLLHLVVGLLYGNDDQVKRERAALVSVFSDALLTKNVRVIVGETYLTAPLDLPAGIDLVAQRYNLTPFYLIEPGMDPRSAEVVFVRNFRGKRTGALPSMVETSAARTEKKFYPGYEDGCYLLLVQPIDVSTLLPVWELPKSYPYDPTKSASNDKTPFAEAIAQLPADREALFHRVYEFAGQKSAVRLRMEQLVESIKQPVPRIEPGPGTRPMSREQLARFQSMTYTAPGKFADDVAQIAKVLASLGADVNPAERIFKVSSLSGLVNSREGEALVEEILLRLRPTDPADTPERQ